MFPLTLSRPALWLACAAALGLGLPLAAQAQSRQDLQKVYMNHLASEGFRPEVTPGGNVHFKNQGDSVVIYIYEDDPGFFRMVTAYSADGQSPEARQRRLEALSLASSETKVVKAYLDNEGDPTFSAEMFQSKPGDANPHIGRMLNAMKLAYDKYRSRMAATSR